MKQEAKKQIVNMFAVANRLDEKAIPVKLHSVIAHAVAPIYLFTECLELSGLSGSSNPIDGLIIIQANRMFGVVSGMLSLLALGHLQQAEVLSRTVMESALTLLYITQENTGARFVQFFQSYIDQEREQNRKWQKELTSLSESWRREHGELIAKKNDALDAMELFLQAFAADIFVPLPSKKGFPNFVAICTALNKAIEYRTIYAAMCSQAHHDAEDLLNDLIIGTSPNAVALSEKLERETNNFSVFIALHGARYCTECLEAIGMRYGLKSVIQQSNKSHAFLSSQLQEVCSGDFIDNSLQGWLPAEI